MRTPIPEERIRALVYAFYDRVRSDALLGPVFEAHIGGAWDAHLEKMCAFWSTVLLATGRYRGNPIEAHARIPDLAPAHFDRWLALFEETARSVLTPPHAAGVVARGQRMRRVLERAADGNPLPTPS
ncbi:MAG TPA: group III truncated hemoglobin [Longimicrobiales bacterium]|nr:group III truncated hemoglobin [Longimicrobiales bacterium]